MDEVGAEAGGPDGVGARVDVPTGVGALMGFSGGYRTHRGEPLWNLIGGIVVGEDPVVEQSAMLPRYRCCVLGLAGAVVLLEV